VGRGVTRTVVMRFHNLPGTRAGVGRTGMRTLIADRPDGVAQGQGLGFNGAELLASALGGCFWNDLHYAAETRGTVLGAVEVEAEVTLSGAPLRVTAATIRARVEAADPAQARDCFDAACADSTIANSVTAAFPVAFAFEDT
jgi:organic hydroperoxide reductase OsmC/OhrA